ncbi:hypothetical protein ACQQ2N_21075 [Dokdonella sp. MW10]|uniref:hypothetical protein n=1 Tax=Dokdonella sp. MW10 TaxID=2992926 RepID=UPI003F8218DA
MRALAVTLAMMGSGAALLAVLDAFVSADLCENTLLEQAYSPDGRMRLVVFERSCGATTGFSTQASLLDAGEPLGDEGGNVFIADTDHGRAPAAAHGGPALDVQWMDDGNVELHHDARARVFHALDALRGVRIARRVH